MESKTAYFNVSDLSRKLPEGSELVILKVRMENDGSGAPDWEERGLVVPVKVYPFSEYETLFGTPYDGNMKEREPQTYLLDDYSSEYTPYPFQSKYSVLPTVTDNSGTHWTNFDCYYQKAPIKLIPEETTEGHVFMYVVSLKLNLGCNILGFESVKALAFDDYEDQTECYIFAGASEDNLGALGYIRTDGTEENTVGCISRVLDDDYPQKWDYKEIGSRWGVGNVIDTVSELYISVLDDAQSLALIGFEITGKMVENGSFDEVDHKKNVLSTLQGAVDELKTANSWLEQIAGK
ncbi:hypothetical protein PM10SUCC1_14810 [Propionigenium maris DSM 9537]|uniref:Uncharacterized protein n=1 Tax=Propionigenium maris DSM 9537 TaxID=1123000 RepID=A0A9W6LMT8_9FUSO|nr:hypothetical protein [Propionigenium maris]GLI55967.1 hypothetical protein PM10SUCC1_14810 [Propionigenium maris DSM 9537]